jgi:hypothetical protein
MKNTWFGEPIMSKFRYRAILAFSSSLRLAT